MPPELVYHYTNASGLLGIISTGRLWMTDIEFLNDAAELAYARKTVLGDLRARADELAPVPRDDEGWGDANGLRAAMLRSIAGELERSPQAQPSTTYHVYAACFCENGDLLSQWRAYGGDRGYAIGFRTASLLEASTSLGVHFTKVTYGLEAARPYLDAMLEAVPQHVAGFPGATGNIKLMTLVLPTVAAIKDPTFAEEQEWRLLSAAWGLSKALLFRPGSVGLVPYIEVGLPDNAVARVIVGPGQYPDVRISAVRQLLERRGMSGAEVERRGMSGVEVVGSTSPLRL
jgi:hypothetical protein